MILWCYNRGAGIIARRLLGFAFGDSNLCEQFRLELLGAFKVVRRFSEIHLGDLDLCYEICLHLCRPFT